jgi:nucleotide-binding universal stress UspA family protein
MVMIYNTIMVQLDIDAPATPRLTFAWQLAQRFEADLIAFAAAEGSTIVSAGDSVFVAAEVVRRQVDEIEERLKVLEQEFQDVTNDSNRASWRCDLGDPTRLLAVQSRSADLVVIGFSDALSDIDHLRTVDAGGLILSAGRPVLLAAENLSPIEAGNVVVAWKDAREARRAVIDALPFLTQARDVLVVTVQEDERKSARESAADVVRFLMKHDVKARFDVIDVGGFDTAEAITEVAREMGADLVVSGGYGHSRIRERAFGGVTRSLLRDGTLHRLISN